VVGVVGCVGNGVVGNGGNVALGMVGIAGSGGNATAGIVGIVGSVVGAEVCNRLRAAKLIWMLESDNTMVRHTRAH